RGKIDYTLNGDETHGAPEPSRPPAAASVVAGGTWEFMYSGMSVTTQSGGAAALSNQASTDIAQIAQTGGQISVRRFTPVVSERWGGTVSGKVLTFAGTLGIGSDVVTSSFKLTIDGRDARGEERWSWTEAGGRCEATAQITAKRIGDGQQ